MNITFLPLYNSVKIIKIDLDHKGTATFFMVHSVLLKTWPRFFLLHFCLYMTQLAPELPNSAIRKITANNVQGRSRSFRVNDFGINRKPICNFQLVINTNLHAISHRFQVIASY